MWLVVHDISGQGVSSLGPSQICRHMKYILGANEIKLPDSAFNFRMNVEKTKDGIPFFLPNPIDDYTKKRTKITLSKPRILNQMSCSTANKFTAARLRAYTPYL